MSDFALKVGSTGNLLNATLRDGNGLPILLTPAGGVSSVKFYMRAVGEPTNTVDGVTCTIRDDGTEALRGQVEYAWSEQDIDTPGLYDAEFKITFSNGKVLRIPEEPLDEFSPSRYFRVAIGNALG